MPFVDDYQKILSLVKQQQLPQLVVMGGEETYLCTKLEKIIVSSLLTEDQLDFNFSTLYGADCSIAEIASNVLRYPVMADRRVVLLKDAQKFSQEEDLAMIFDRIPKSTHLIIHAYAKNIDRRKKWIKQAEKLGLVYNSPKLTAYKVKAPLKLLLDETGVKLDATGKDFLVETVGSDLTRLRKALDKLALSAEAKSGKVLPMELLMEHIGQSREFSYFELQTALASKDATRAHKIVRAYAADQKNYPIQATLSMLFGFFSNLLIAYDCASRQEQQMAKFLGLNSGFQARDYLTALRYHSKPKVQGILTMIRRSDARSKGLYTYEPNALTILTDLVYYITS